MRKLLPTAVWAVLALLLAVPLAAQETKKESGGQQQPPGGEQMDEVMAAWLKYAEPGEHHGHLKPLAGKWEMAGKFRFSPEAPWEELASKCDTEWILGERFLTQKVKGEPMPGSETPFEGFGILGYDNYKKRYASVWMDNMGTICMTAEGTCDADGKKITFIGSYDDPLSGSKKEYRTVYRIESNDKYVMEGYEKGPDGKEFVTMEITATRK